MADRTVFVIRDFEVDQSVGLALQFLAQFPPLGTRLSIPGIPGAPEQGRLIEDVVNPVLAQSQYVISFMDTPNANVGFELGFALGSDRHVALVCAAPALPDWLDAAPLSGYLVAKGVQLPRLKKIIEQGEHINVDGSPSRGSDVLFLCPRAGEGLVGHELVSRVYPLWRSPQQTGWKLQDLPRQLDNVGEVLWLITPFAEGTDRKDGQGNSLNAVIAGYAKGKRIPLRILKSTHHRRIVDIEDNATQFTNLDELQNLLREVEEKRKVAIAGTIFTLPPVPDTKLERVFPKEEFVGLNWYQRSLDVARAVGRLSIAGKPTATCFLVSPLHVLTPFHVLDISQNAEEYAVVFEGVGTETGVIRRAKTIVWSSGSSDLDAMILELDDPVNEASPLSLRAAGKSGAIVGDRVVVVGYPHGGALSFSLSESAIVAFSDHVVCYSTPTAPGSSGSPVFDGNWNLLAMHHALLSIGWNQDGTNVSEGILASAILAALEQDPVICSTLGLSDPN